MMKAGLVALAGFACATSASASSADNPFVQETAILDLKGLDLSTAKGQQRLALRMDRAARAVCGQRLATIHLALERQAQDCRAEVVADVRTQIEARMAKVSSGSAVQLASAK